MGKKGSALHLVILVVLVLSVIGYLLLTRVQINGDGNDLVIIKDTAPSITSAPDPQINNIPEEVQARMESYNAFDKNRKKYQSSKDCTNQPVLSTNSDLIAYIKSKRNPGGEQAPRAYLWLSDGDGCNPQQISTTEFICKIFGFSPDGAKILVATCDQSERSMWRSGVFYNSLQVVDWKNKTTNKLTEFYTDGGGMTAFWVDNYSIWYYMEDESPFEEVFGDRNAPYYDIEEPESAVKDEEIAKYFEKKGVPLVRSVSIDRKLGVVAYPTTNILMGDTEFEVSPVNKRIYLYGGELKLYDISTPYTSYMEGKNISLPQSPVSAGNDYDENYWSLFTILNSKILFRQNGELYTTDLNGNNKQLYIKTDKNTFLLGTMSSSGNKALYPVNDCNGSLDIESFKGRKLAFYSKNGHVKSFNSHDLIFANNLDTFFLLDRKTFRYPECSDWYILDTSQKDLNIVSTLCNDDTWCVEAVIK